MLYRTVQFAKGQTFCEQQEDHLVQNQLQFVKGQLKLILTTFNQEKNELEKQYFQQNKQLKLQIQQKSNQIEKLSKNLHQIQKENEQIKFQYHQRVSLSKILKQQLNLLSRQHQSQSQTFTKTIQFLESENVQLQQQSYHLQRQNQLLRQSLRQKRQKIMILQQQSIQSQRQMLNLPQFHSLQQLPSHKKVQSKGIYYQSKGFSDYFQCSNDFDCSLMQDLHPNLSQSSISHLMKDHKASRITQIKGKSSGKYKNILQKMATKTNLSRQKTHYQKHY